jgi:hypothetical protein
LTLQNNELWGGANDLSGWTNTTTVTLNNNLFWRSSFFASNTSAQASLYLMSCKTNYERESFRNWLTLSVVGFPGRGYIPHPSG